jgi:hypothetical protein
MTYIFAELYHLIRLPSHLLPLKRHEANTSNKRSIFLERNCRKSALLLTQYVSRNAGATEGHEFTFATVVSIRSCFTSCDTIVLPREVGKGQVQR